MSADAPSRSPITFRHEVRSTDADAVRAIVESTEKFRPDEVAVAMELVEERLKRGDASGYFFVFAESAGEVIGYTCYGPIACTVASYDLFWIAVRQDQQGRGLGRQLVLASESLIRRAGGLRVYIETSGRPDYLPTRTFYDRCGYTCEATIHSFYAPGDDKCIYVKALDAPNAPA